MVNSGNLRLIENDTITNAMSKYFDLIINYKEYDAQIKEMRSNLYPEVLKIEDMHDFFRFDQSGNALTGYNPEMDRFPPMSIEQRRSLVSYYRLYISQTRAELLLIRRLSKANDELLVLINRHLDKNTKD